MIPDYNTFADQCSKFGRVVFYREISGDMITPISMLKNFQHHENLFLLESANIDKSFSRYTFFGCEPESVITYKKGVLTVKTSGSSEVIKANPIDYMMELLAKETSAKDNEMGNFCGGYVGFLTYDMSNYMGNLRSKIREDDENLLMAFVKTDRFYVFDNHLRKLFAACSVKTGGNPASLYDEAKKITLDMARKTIEEQPYAADSDSDIKFRKDFEKDDFIRHVELLKSEIEKGEGIQVILSNKYQIDAQINPLNLYRVMRNINPSPYMIYLKFGDEVICGTSPEVHLKVSDKTATLKPIAGTYRIDRSRIEEQKKELLKDEKELAEHLMLIDLARNDLYTGCETDSVKVVKSFSPEEYSHVIHIVSEVEGKLREDVPALRLFCSTFPAGTVSGAPKVRAMELIDQYERSARGFYAGCAGYFSYSGDLDTCITIRCAHITKEKVVLRAGAGLVYDSVPEKEFHEVENKLAVLFAALGQITDLEKKNVFDDR